MIFALVAWLIAVGSIGGVAMRLRRLNALELPSARALADRVRAEMGELVGSAAWRGLLDELVLEVDQATRAGAELPRALTRLVLTSGTACALLALLQDVSSPDWASIVAAFCAGVVGMFATSAVGRRGELRARHVRDHWSGVARQAFRSLDHNAEN